MRSSFVAVISVFIGCIAGCAAQNDINVTTLTVTAPDPTSSNFLVGVGTAVTFTLEFTVQGSVTPSDVKVYFSNGDGSTKSNEVTAGGSNAPDGSSAATGSSYAGLTATLVLDKPNCASYTKLCGSITVTDDDSSNNEACADIGSAADEAGHKTCSNDVLALSLTVTDPAPAVGVFYVNTDVPTTLNLAYNAYYSGGFPSDVKVYFSNADGSTKSAEVTATGSNAPDGSAVTSSGSFDGMMATLTLDAENCDAYTKVCGTITVSDSDMTNHEACSDFGTDVADAGTKNCTVVQEMLIIEETTTEMKCGAQGLSFGIISFMTIMVASVLA
ncbi:uncharacterized protein [Ptychodera flava]|uniref:uncharacterized protein isoform X2 n=1 Tax=Ptychodera flava TaxID=63121 RepID=UPI00396A2182